MKNLTNIVVRLTQVLHYLFLSALILLMFIGWQELSYHEEVLLVSKVTGGLLIISIAVEILLSNATQSKKLQWLSSVILPQLIASIYLPDLWLLAIALSALIFANVTRKKLYIVNSNKANE